MVVNSQTFSQVREAWLGDIVEGLQHSLFGNKRGILTYTSRGHSLFYQTGQSLGPFTPTTEWSTHSVQPNHSYTHRNHHICVSKVYKNANINGHTHHT